MIVSRDLSPRRVEVNPLQRVLPPLRRGKATQHLACCARAHQVISGPREDGGCGVIPWRILSAHHHNPLREAATDTQKDRYRVGAQYELDWLLKDGSLIVIVKGQRQQAGGGGVSRLLLVAFEKTGME